MHYGGQIHCIHNILMTITSNTISQKCNRLLDNYTTEHKVTTIFVQEPVTTAIFHLIQKTVTVYTEIECLIITDLKVQQCTP